MMVAIKSALEIINRCPCLIVKVDIIRHTERCPLSQRWNRNISRRNVLMISGVSRIIIENSITIDSCPETVQFNRILDNESIHQHLEADFLVNGILNGRHHIRQTRNLKHIRTS